MLETYEEFEMQIQAITSVKGLFVCARRSGITTHDLRIYFSFEKTMTALACIVFGYNDYSAVPLPAESISNHSGADDHFLRPVHVEKEFLTISAFYSATVTGVTFLRRDALTPLFGADIFTLFGAGALLVLALILHLEPTEFLKTLHPAIIQSAGALLVHASSYEEVANLKEECENGVVLPRNIVACIVDFIGRRSELG